MALNVPVLRMPVVKVKCDPPHQYAKTVHTHTHRKKSTDTEISHDEINLLGKGLAVQPVVHSRATEYSERDL